MHLFFICKGGSLCQVENPVAVLTPQIADMSLICQGNICYLDELVCWSFTVYLMRIMFPFCNNTKREERFAHVSPAIHSSSSSSIIIYMGDNACNVCVSTYVRFGVLLVDFYTWENGSLSHLGTGDNGHKTCRKMNITQQKHWDFRQSVSKECVLFYIILHC